MGSLERAAKRKVRAEYNRDQKMVANHAAGQLKAAHDLVKRLREAKVTEKDLEDAERIAVDSGIIDATYTKEHRRMIAMQVVDQSLKMSKVIPNNG